MPTRPHARLLRCGLVAAALTAALGACAQPARPVAPPSPVDLPQPFPAIELQRFLEQAQRSKLPFEIDIRLAMRCLGGQCNTVVKPSNQPVEDWTRIYRFCSAKCTGRAGDALSACMEECGGTVAR